MGPPPSFRECVTYGKNRNIVNGVVFASLPLLLGKGG